MPALTAIAAFLEKLAPLGLPRSGTTLACWSGGGARRSKGNDLLDHHAPSAAEAIEGGAGLVVTHHPLPFSALRRLTDERPPAG